MIYIMEDEDRAYSAVVEFETLNGHRITHRYGPYSTKNPATARINSLRARYTPKGATQVMHMRFVSGRVEISGYVWGPIDGTV